MKLVKKVKNKMVKKINKIIDKFKPFIQTKDYLGFKLFYSKGTSLIDRIKSKNVIYEPETCNLIVSGLKGVDKPIFIDIGANIGLISLHTAKYVPNVLIHAFEPGPHQAELFTKTINANNLSETISLHKIALSNTTGYLDFFVHKSQHVSGDGFFDTERAGHINEKIKVETKTLDQWWDEQNKPFVNLIKIDTEGAELWVLEGAKELIKTCKPIIITEINRPNYINYPYNEYDVLALLHKYNYTVYTENNIIATKVNIEEFQTMGIDTYCCKHNNVTQA